MKTRIMYFIKMTPIVRGNWNLIDLFLKIIGLPEIILYNNQAIPDRPVI